LLDDGHGVIEMALLNRPTKGMNHRMMMVMRVEHIMMSEQPSSLPPGAVRGRQMLSELCDGQQSNET
jgi:hypothetical protein